MLLSLFLSVHINLQCKLKYHTSSFIVTFYLFSSVALLIFSHLQFHCFFPIIFYYKCNMCKWFILLQVPSFVSNMACNGVLTPPAKVTPQIGNPPSPTIFHPAPTPPYPPHQSSNVLVTPPTGNGCFCIFHTWLLPTSTYSYF